MRLLHTIHSVNPQGGGVIEGILRVSKHHLGQGHQVEIVSSDLPEDPWVAECPVTVHPLANRRTSYGYSPRWVPWLRENAHRFDVVVVNGLWQYPSFAVWRALGGKGGSRRSETRGRRSEVEGSPARHKPSAASRKPPYVVFPHGMLDPWFKRRYPLKHLKKWLYWPWAEYRVLRDARAVFFSNPTERDLARQSFRLYRCNEAIAGFGVSRPTGDPALQREAFLSAFPELRGSRLILFLSRIHEKKGPDLAIKAFGEVQRRMPEAWGEVRLVMAGPPASEAYGRKLRDLSDAACRPGSVCWTGMLPVEQKWGAMRAAEVFLLPSHQENYGLAVAEALACGLPVLISREVNVWRDVIGDGAGLAEADTVDGTQSLLERWHTLGPIEQEGMRQAALRCFEKRYEASKKADEMLLAFRTRGMSNEA